MKNHQIERTFPDEDIKTMAQTKMPATLRLLVFTWPNFQLSSSSFQNLRKSLMFFEFTDLQKNPMILRANFLDLGKAALKFF